MRTVTLISVIMLGLVGTGAASAAEPYVNFESHQFRPLALSPDGTRLFVTNTPDNRVEVFDITGTKPQLVASVPVGLEPVAIAARNEREIWVVNHLSDSVSVVDVAAAQPQVVRTLLVGDEPRDIVFAGPGNARAFISAAHRGQNSPYTDPRNPGELTTPGVGRADVWVFDADATGAGPGGKPLAVVPLFGDSPGPLAVTPDGETVYVGVFKSGNQTTIVGRVLICEGGADVEPCEVAPGGPIAPGGLPAPNASVEGEPMPHAGLIVRWDGKGWKDELDRDWSSVIKLDLPDYDVFALDALANPPRQAAVYPHVGTVLFSLAVNPQSGKLYVANTEARNEVRFEGSREPGSTISTVQGHLHETRITVIDPAKGTVTPRHLNTHIDYNQRFGDAETRERSLSMPVGLAVTQDGKTVYVAAKGSDKVAVYNTPRLERAAWWSRNRAPIELPDAGPAGLILDEPRARLYVLGRFDNSLAVVDTRRNEVVERVALFDPEPPEIRNGRPFFYNARLTSGNGESSCASCHIAGDKDELAWDLGDPYDKMLNNPATVLGPLRGDPRFHPMKGPMLTQTMRGIANHGALHWRGDRTAGNDPGGDPYDTEGAMLKFNIGFISLLGREKMLTDEQMQQLTDFSLRMVPPPNPIRALDDSLTPAQAEGKKLFETARALPGGATCAMCHPVNRERGLYGTSGVISFVIGGRLFKVPSHRNTYERAGMFGRAPSFTLLRDPEHMGPQIRGYGYTHDGGADTVVRFLSYPAFRWRNGDDDRRAIEQYLFAFESNMKPVVGQQVTLSARSDTAANERAALLIQRALAGDADLVVTGVVDGMARGFLLLPDGNLQGDRQGEDPVSVTALLDFSTNGSEFLTLTAVPPGTGKRLALDRDLDGAWNGDAASARTVSSAAAVLHRAP